MYHHSGIATFPKDNHANNLKGIVLGYSFSANIRETWWLETWWCNGAKNILNGSAVWSHLGLLY